MVSKTEKKIAEGLLDMLSLSVGDPIMIVFTGTLARVICVSPSVFQLESVWNSESVVVEKAL